MTIVVKKLNNETNEHLIQRFRKQVKNARLIQTLKKSRYHTRAKTKTRIREEAIMRADHRAKRDKELFFLNWFLPTTLPSPRSIFLVSITHINMSNNTRSLVMFIIISLSLVISACGSKDANQSADMAVNEQKILDETALDQIYAERDAALTGSGQIVP